MIYKGKVISTHLQDPTNLVRVAVPQVSGTKTQTARVGISDVIEPGDQVWVGYEAGDFSAPVVLGKVGEPPVGPEGLPASRNLLHNGAMQVHQRSTSVASITTSNWYTADRWYAAMSALGTWTQSVEVDAPTGSGFQKSLKMLCTTADASPAAGDVAMIRQRIEGQNLQHLKKGTANAEQLTLSFWTKSNTTGTYIAVLYDNDNARHVSASYSVVASGTWEQQSVTFPADVTGAFDNDAEASLSVEWWLASGSTYTSGTLGTTWGTTTANRAVGQTNLAATTSNYWQITGAQLEVGAVATEYQFKSYGQELQECQRYFYSGVGNALVVDPGALKRFHLLCGFPVTMRAAPTVTLSEFKQYNGVPLTVSVNPAVNQYGYTSTFGETSANMTANTAHQWTGTFSADL